MPRISRRFRKDWPTCTWRCGAPGCTPSCTLTYPELRYTYDSRDNVLEPTAGFFGTLSLQQTLKPGSFSYFRLEPEVRAYFPMTPWLVVAARAQYQADVNRAFAAVKQTGQRKYSQSPV